MKSVQITYDAKVKIGTSYERGEACTQLDFRADAAVPQPDFLDDKVVESLIADVNAAPAKQSSHWFDLLQTLTFMNMLQGRIFIPTSIKTIQVVAEIPN